MNIVITTGCPNSGWETALPALQQAGLGLAGGSFTRWHDELFKAAGVDDLLGMRQPLQPGPGLEESAAALFPSAPSAPLLLSDSRSLWVLDFWAARLPHAQFLLFYAPAEAALANAIPQGVDPRRFLEGWHAACGQMLRFQRRHRRRALLLDAGAAVSQPRALIDVCGRLGLAMQTLPPGLAPVSVLPTMERLLAGYLVAAQPAVQALQAELEASAQPLGDAAPPVQLQPEALFNNYLQWQQQLDESDRKLRVAQQALDTQHQRLQAQIAQLTKARDEQAKLVAERQAQLDKERQAGQTLAATHEETVKENELLLLQLHQVQEELETIFLRKQQLEQEQAAQRKQLRQVNEELKNASAKNQKLEQEIEEQRQRVARLKQTASWKITAPVRAIARPFNRSDKKQKKTQKETREQVLLLRASGLFDEAWYRSEYADVAGNGIDPVEHYLLHGAAEGRNPSPQFDGRGYLEANKDVAGTGMNPLLHYVKFGKAEGRKGFEAKKR